MNTIQIMDVEANGKTYAVTVKERNWRNQSGCGKWYQAQLPDDLLGDTGWQPGSSVIWYRDPNGKITLSPR